MSEDSHQEYIESVMTIVRNAREVGPVPKIVIPFSRKIFPSLLASLFISLKKEEIKARVVIELAQMPGMDHLVISLASSSVNKYHFKSSSKQREFIHSIVYCFKNHLNQGGQEASFKLSQQHQGESVTIMADIISLLQQEGISIEIQEKGDQLFISKKEFSVK